MVNDPEASAAFDLHHGSEINVDSLRKYPHLLDTYPHRYLFLTASQLTRNDQRALPKLFTGVELLESRGWEPVSWEIYSGQGGVFGAVMRRLEPSGREMC